MLGIKEKISSNLQDIDDVIDGNVNNEQVWHGMLAFIPQISSTRALTTVSCAYVWKVIHMDKRSPKKIAKRARQPEFTVRKGPEGELKLPDGAGSVIYIREFLSPREADELMESTNISRSWARTPISFFGKSVLQPRDTAFFGTKLYSYSDERRVPTHWDDDPPASTALRDLGTRIEKHLELPKGWFNVILANRYHHGQDFMGWHSDNEKSLGEEPIIASISLGAERRFLIRKKSGDSIDQTREKIEYVLAHGSLLVMTGKMQKFYQHSLPKVALSRCSALRLNFTYRRVVDESDHSKE